MCIRHQPGSCGRQDVADLSGGNAHHSHRSRRFFSKAVIFFNNDFLIVDRMQKMSTFRSASLILPLNMINLIPLSYIGLDAGDGVHEIGRHSRRHSHRHIVIYIYIYIYILIWFNRQGTRSLLQIISFRPQTGHSLHEATPKQLKTIESTLQTTPNIFKTN